MIIMYSLGIEESQYGDVSNTGSELIVRHSRRPVRVAIPGTEPRCRPHGSLE